MIQTIRTLVENTDSLYEKIVQCQKAGKCKLFFKNIIKNLLRFSYFPKLLIEFVYLTVAKNSQQPNNNKKIQTKKEIIVI